MGCRSEWEQRMLIQELNQGMDVAKQLRVHLNTTSSPSETKNFLLQRVFSSLEKCLFILGWSGSVEQSQAVIPTMGLPESSISVDGSPRSDEFDRGFNDHQDTAVCGSKKRKTLPTWTDQVKVTTETGLEGSHDDGYSWRKYGQKDILGAKFPRSYYRCTYRSMKNCWATKQVQRSDEDPTIFDITYKGQHTCCRAPPSVPYSPQTKQPKINHHYPHNQTPPQPTPGGKLWNFQANLRVNTEDEMVIPFSFPPNSFEDLLGGYSPAFVSPATSGSNYFSISPENGFGNGQNLAGGISATNSSTNSPIGDLDFSIDHVNLDPNFPFDTLGFLT